MRILKLVALIALTALLAGSRFAAAQSPVVNFFALSDVQPTGVDVFLTWGPVVNSGDWVAGPIAGTDLTSYFVETGPTNDCRAGIGDCKTYPYISFEDDATNYYFVDTTYWLQADGPFRFKILNTGFKQHVAQLCPGFTCVQIGNAVTSLTHNTYRSVAMGFESLTASRISKPMHFASAQFQDGAGSWFSFCPSYHGESGATGAVLIPCMSGTPGEFFVVPGVRAWLPSQVRP